MVDNSQQLNHFEIEDVEDYRSDNMQVFNHQMLVMEVLRKLNEAGCHELRTGFLNEKVESNGNIIRTYIEDTRKKFIESVKTAVNVMICDFDKDAEDEIEYLRDELEFYREELLKEQWQWYQDLNPREKQYFTGKIARGFFHQEMGWYLRYMELEIECHRLIAAELHKLTKRLKFYQVADLEI